MAKVPSPADAPRITARSLLSKVRRDGGKTFRMREWFVFVITESPELAQWLLDLGASPYLPRNGTPTYESPRGAYRDAKGGPPKWDLYVHTIPVIGETTVWEAANITDAELFEVA